MLQSRRGVPTAGLALQWSDRSGFRFSGFAQHQGIADKYSDTQHTHECREVPGNLSGLQLGVAPCGRMVQNLKSGWNVVKLAACNQCGKKAVEPLHVDWLGHEDGAFRQATFGGNFFLRERRDHQACHALKL